MPISRTTLVEQPPQYCQASTSGQVPCSESHHFSPPTSCCKTDLNQRVLETASIGSVNGLEDWVFVLKESPRSRLPSLEYLPVCPPWSQRRSFLWKKQVA